MTKRKFATLLVAIMLGLTANIARAQTMSVAVDGCAELARVIYTEVSAAALYGPGNSGPWMISPGQGDIALCEHTARVVSRAFTSAMMSAGIAVYWDNLPQDRGDYCLSGFLSQCYPKRDAVFFVADSADTVLVNKIWTVVSQAVMRQMYNPFSSDEVRFRSDELKLKIGLSLRSIGAKDHR